MPRLGRGESIKGAQSGVNGMKYCWYYLVSEWLNFQMFVEIRGSLDSSGPTSLCELHVQDESNNKDLEAWRIWGAPRPRRWFDKSHEWVKPPPSNAIAHQIRKSLAYGLLGMVWILKTFSSRDQLQITVARGDYSCGILDMAQVHAGAAIPIGN